MPPAKSRRLNFEEAGPLSWIPGRSANCVFGEFQQHCARLKFDYSSMVRVFFFDRWVLSELVFTWWFSKMRIPLLVKWSRVVVFYCWVFLFCSVYSLHILYRLEVNGRFTFVNFFSCTCVWKLFWCLKNQVFRMFRFIFIVCIV